jgi:photosystem II stability/assembly factor-like uncharacterized protein
MQTNSPAFTKRAFVGALAATAASSIAPPSSAQGDRAAPSAWRTLPTVAYRGKQDDIATLNDGMTAWYGNGKGLLYRTLDGGESWEQIWSQPGTFVRALGFLDAQNGFLGNVGTDYYPGVTDSHPLYRTRDGGRSFEKVEAPGISNVKGICGIHILRQKRILQGELRETSVIHAAGRVGGPAWVLRSEDSGETWKVLDLSAYAGMILDICFLSPQVGFVCASTSGDIEQGEALMLRTENGGQTWSTVYRGGRKMENCWKMSFPSRRVGYATVQSYDDANPRQIIIKTTNGGRSWRELEVVRDPKSRQFGIGFVDEQRGWIGARAGGFQTRDGGKTWQTDAAIGQAVNKIRVVETAFGKRIFAIGVGVARLDLG